MGQVSVITGVQRRRIWSDEQRLELVSAAFSPGARVAEVARRADVCTSGPAPARAAITIVLPGGSTVSIDPDASPALVKATLRALR
jgi:transposase